MKNKTSKINSISLCKYLLTLLLFLPFLGHAQQNVEMADAFRSNGKIYVVVLVICTIFAGIILFLVFLERKIKRLERNQLN
ncbi:CcmD family protein [Taibaiella lutea]|uniref:CcmD family protein n=1 Tax=Taibaiella lutea TaxID=2608001 RepID=UPI003743AA66